MKSITQEDTFGCSLACIAFLLDKNYQEIVKLAGQDQAHTKGFYCKELVQLLAKLGESYTYKYLKPRFKRKIYLDKVIVFIKRSKKYPSGHYLARLNNLWMDPWINFQQGAKVENAKSGFRKRLPGRPIYGLFPADVVKLCRAKAR
jgi:hypothetical protein